MYISHLEFGDVEEAGVHASLGVPQLASLDEVVVGHLHVLLAALTFRSGQESGGSVNCD